MYMNYGTCIVLHVRVVVQGYVISDGLAIKNIQTRFHYLNDSVEVAAYSIINGCNMELFSSVFQKQTDALKRGKKIIY